MDILQKIACTNGNASKKMLLIVEPWAEEYWIEPGETVEVVGRSGKSGYFEIEYSDQYILVYGWEDSVVSVFKHGVLIEPSLQR